MFFKKVVLKIFAIFIWNFFLQYSYENTCVRVSFLIKLHATLLKRDSSTGIFCELCSIWKTPFLKNICEQLLLINRTSMNGSLRLREHVNYHVKGKTDSKEIRTHNHLVCRRTLNHLAKLAKWYRLVFQLLLRIVSYKNRYAYITDILSLLPLFNPWLIVEM